MTGAPIRTHCKRGHLLTEDNIYRPPSRPDQRMCLTCHRGRGTTPVTTPEQREQRVVIASLRAELAGARQQLKAQRRVIADLQREVSLLRSRQRVPQAVSHRRMADGGIGGRAERRALRDAADRRLRVA